MYIYLYIYINTSLKINTKPENAETIIIFKSTFKDNRCSSRYSFLRKWMRSVIFMSSI